MTLIDILSNTFVQTLILTIVSAIVAAFFATRPRVVWSEAHESIFRLKEQDSERPLYVYTSEIWIKNTGRAQAKQLEVILNYRPRHYKIWTPRKCKEEELPDNRFSLTFETIAPQDEFEVSMLSTDSENPLVIEIRHEAGVAQKMEMQTTAKPGKVLLGVCGILLLVGFVVVLYQIAAFIGPMLIPSP